MGTSSRSTAGTRSVGHRLSAIDGRVVSLLAIGLALALALVGPALTVPFVAIAGIGLVLAALAAHRWPLSTLIASSLVVLADLEITDRILPAALDQGFIGLSEPLLLVVGTVIAIDAARRGAFVAALRDPVLVLVALFVAVSIVSAVANRVPPHVALLGIVMTVDAIAIYFVARMTPGDVTTHTLGIGAVVGTIVVACLFGIGQMVVAPSLFGFDAIQGQFGEGTRITSFIGHPNMVAALVGIAVPFAALATRHLPRVRGQWIAGVALVVLLIALLWTFSRGGWMAVGLGATVGLLLVDWRSVPILLLAAAIAWGATTVAPRAIAAPTGTATPVTAEASDERPSVDEAPAASSPAPTLAPSAPPSPPATAEPSEAPSIIDSTIRRLTNLLNSNDTRGRYLRDGLRIVSDNPILGVGPGRYGGAAAAIIPSPVYEEYGATLFTYRTVHNFWLHLVGEGGALGISVFVTLILGLIIRLARAARAATGPGRLVVGGAATMLIVSSLHGLTEMTFEGNMPALLIWMILGLASTRAPSKPLFIGRRTNGGPTPEV